MHMAKTQDMRAVLAHFVFHYRRKTGTDRNQQPVEGKSSGKPSSHKDSQRSRECYVYQ